MSSIHRLIAGRCFNRHRLYNEVIPFSIVNQNRKFLLGVDTDLFVFDHKVSL